MSALVRRVGTIGGLTLVSRVLGLARDTLMARYVGAGMAADAFLIAWRLPNLFRALFAEGAFSAVFVPQFNRAMTEAEREAAGEGRRAAIDFASAVLSVLFPVLVLFTIAMIALSAPIVWAMTGGFPDGGPEKFDLAVLLTRITFPYLALISIVSLLGGILNSIERFWVNAAAPILLNICMIVALVFFRGSNEIDTAITQAIAVTVSGVLQLAWLIWACVRAGVMPRLSRPRLTEPVRRMLTLIGPAALGQGAIQLNLLVSTSLAARFLAEGSVSYLYYADRLNQLPLGLIGIAVGTAILPPLSRAIAGNDADGAGAMQNRAFELAWALALPAAIALAVSATPLIRGVLQNGVFTAADTIGAASALAVFALGVPAYVLIKVLTPGFYAREDTKTPVRIALWSMLVNLIGNLTLIWSMGHVGVAAATAASAWVNVIALYVVLRRRGHFTLDARTLSRGLRILIAGVVMGVALWFLNPLLDPYMDETFWVRVAALAALCGAGGLVYGLAVLLLGGVKPGEIRALFTRKG